PSPPPAPEGPPDELEAVALHDGPAQRLRVHRSPPSVLPTSPLEKESGRRAHSRPCSWSSSNEYRPPVTNSGAARSGCVAQGVVRRVGRLGHGRLGPFPG